MGISINTENTECTEIIHTERTFEIKNPRKNFALSRFRGNNGAGGLDQFVLFDISYHTGISAAAKNAINATTIPSLSRFEAFFGLLPISLIEFKNIISATITIIR